MQDALPLKAIFTMSIPVILGMMVNVVYNLVDTWFISMMGDELQLAASSYCTPIFVIILVRFVKCAKPKADTAVYDFLMKKEAEGKPPRVAKIAALNKFLIIYYARVKELYC